MTDYTLDIGSSDFPLYLTDSESQRLEVLESVINAGMQTFVHVGNALLEIRDGRLYRQTHSTFEDYCRERWGMSKTHANRMIDSAEVVSNLTPIGVIPNTESQARPLTVLEPQQQREAWQRAVETAPDGKITAAHVQTVVNEFRTPLPLTAANHAPSADPDYDGDEWYTPANVIAHARNVFGGVIDLDPATNQAAQAVINATTYYTKADNGLRQPWHGNVWLNPPYSMPLIAQFVDRALDAYASREINAAIILTNNSSDTRWFQALLRRCPVCLPAGRLDFWRANQQSFAARQGQAIFYMGIDRPKFVREFSVIGAVLEAI